MASKHIKSTELNTKIDSNGNLYLKKEILKSLNWKKNDNLILEVDIKNNKVVIKKRMTVLERLAKNIEEDSIINISEEEDLEMDKEISEMLEN